jgi:hypothetical protein
MWSEIIILTPNFIQRLNYVIIIIHLLLYVERFEANICAMRLELNITAFISNVLHKVVQKWNDSDRQEYNFSCVCIH